MGDKTICELCGTDQLGEVYLPDAAGEMTVRSSLRFCPDCRVVILPRPSRMPPPPGRQQPGSSLGNGWPVKG